VKICQGGPSQGHLRSSESVEDPKAARGILPPGSAPGSRAVRQTARLAKATGRSDGAAGARVLVLAPGDLAEIVAPAG